jgi:hypothetical protein
MHRTRLLPVLCLLAASAAPARAALQPGWHFAGHGTATINGVIGASEWAGADVRNVNVGMPAGGTVPAVLRVMHDNSNIYVSIDITGTTTAAVFQVDFDSDGSNNCSQNDDAFGVNISNFFFDTFHDVPSGCSTNADVNTTGTSNGSGAVVSSGGHMVFEVAHPLDSGDALDVDLQPLEVVGMLAHTFLCQGACVETFFPPGGTLSSTGAFHVFGLFVDDFELGHGLSWSLHVP